MANKIVLISDDSNFFDFIKTKLELRKSDELFTYSFDSVLDKLYLLSSALFIIDSENSKEKTLDLLNILKGIPSIVCAYNDDEVFRRKCYRAGMFDFITLLVSDSDFRARILPALSVCSLLEKNNHYRNILVKNNFLNKNNEVYINFDSVIDEELAIINQTKKKAVFVAIAPSDKSKFLIKTSNDQIYFLLNGEIIKVVEFSCDSPDTLDFEVEFDGYSNTQNNELQVYLKDRIAFTNIYHIESHYFISGVNIMILNSKRILRLAPSIDDNYIFSRTFNSFPQYQVATFDNLDFDNGWQYPAGYESMNGAMHYYFRCYFLNEDGSYSDPIEKSFSYKSKCTMWSLW